MECANFAQMRLILILFIFNWSFLFSQKPIADLPKELAETSALVLIDDLFYTLNDSGNDPIIFVFDVKGNVLHSCWIDNVSNIDWEALAFDGEKFYIGDIGNNSNSRKNLMIYEVDKDSVRLNKTTNAKIIRFEYEKQMDFPPEKAGLYFDAECLVIKNDSLFILTKNRTEPFDGISQVYYVEKQFDKMIKAKHLFNLHLKATNWMEESITDAQLCGENLFVLTYSKVYQFQWLGKQFREVGVYNFDRFTQKEGLTMDHRFFYLTDEDESILSGGNHLYKLKR